MVDLIVKDVALACELAAEHGVDPAWPARRSLPTGARRSRASAGSTTRPVVRASHARLGGGRTAAASGASGVLPRIRSAAFSATIITGA